MEGGEISADWEGRGRGAKRGMGPMPMPCPKGSNCSLGRGRREGGDAKTTALCDRTSGSTQRPGLVRLRDSEWLNVTHYTFMTDPCGFET